MSEKNIMRWAFQQLYVIGCYPSIILRHNSLHSVRMIAHCEKCPVLCTLIIASARASFPPTFPGKTTRGSPGHLLSLAMDHTGTPGRICPITFEHHQGRG